ncbi:TIGR03503 family protein [Echinimonas agarilytica]|uniref:TIGR03503 family protein n=1 Tax=Echinimonas agarilytica TaxID=1215918 RepID=A0AA42B7L2_9GAMM|nr:TIGR03503 family protein [Echinimonas agarilytica]MCM2679523.1 TIGR03503 family protein [Echinimonas agarilytica]
MSNHWFLGFVLALTTLVAPLSTAQDESVTRSAYKLLDNRFRLDHGIDEVSLVVYRKPGSGPVLFVRPDGSKLYAHSTPENVKWYDEQEFDLITITKPMPGPWQIVGTLDPRNSIEILSDIQLTMDEAPRSIYQFERLKVTAELRNYGTRITNEAFYKSTSLEMFLLRRGIATSDDELTTTTKIGQFYDNGTLLDEYPRDGVYTGELDFRADPGRYQLFSRVKNKTFSRTFVQDVELKKIPIQAKVIRVSESAKRIHYSINPIEVQLETVAINLMIEGPNDFQYPFSMVAPEKAQMDVELDFIDRTGDYRIGGWMFATTSDGREVALEIPKERFSVIIDSQQEVAVPELSTGRVVASDSGAETALPEITEPMMQPPIDVVEPPKEEESGSLLWLWITISMGVVLAIIGGVVFILLRKRKKSSENGEDSDNDAEAGGIDLNRPEDR